MLKELSTAHGQPQYRAVMHRKYHAHKKTMTLTCDLKIQSSSRGCHVSLQLSAVVHELAMMLKTILPSRAVMI